MRFEVDVDNNEIVLQDEHGRRSVPLYSTEGFEALSAVWLKAAWNQKLTYTYTWLGRPVIQLAEDLMRLQEVVWALRPDVIIETGIAHGGSAVFLASLCRLMGKGRVVAVDIEIRPHNRAAIEAHPLKDLITLIEGDAIAPDIVAQVHGQVADDDVVLVLLDSNHTKQHVLGELEAYAQLVSPSSWIVVTDGFMADVADAPRGDREWTQDNPVEAARDFLERHPEFVLEPPPWPFNESDLRTDVTHWPDAWLRRRGDQ